MKKFVMVLLLLCLLTIPCAAEEYDEFYEEQLEASGAEELTDVLPPETQELLDKLGITDFSENSALYMSVEDWLPHLWELVGSSSSGPIAAGAVVIGVILLCALAEGFRQTADGASGTLFSSVSVLACCAALVVPLIGCIERVMDAADSTSVFMTSFTPVYAGILATSGHGTAAFSFQSVLFVVTELISYRVSNVILPLLIIAFAMGLVGSVGDVSIGSADSFKKAQRGCSRR